MTTTEFRPDPQVSAANTHRTSAGSSLNLDLCDSGENGSGKSSEHSAAPIPSFLRIPRALDLPVRGSAVKAGGGGPLTQPTPARILLRNLKAAQSPYEEVTPEITVGDLEVTETDTDEAWWLAARVLVWLSVILVAVVAYFGVDWR